MYPIGEDSANALVVQKYRGQKPNCSSTDLPEEANPRYYPPRPQIRTTKLRLLRVFSSTAVEFASFKLPVFQYIINYISLDLLFSQRTLSKIKSVDKLSKRESSLR